MKKTNQIKLKELIPDLEIDDIDFSGISTDSRKVKVGELFIAYKGIDFDGNDYIDVALKKGASAVISDSLSNPSKKIFRLKDLKDKLGRIISEYYQHPSQKINLIAVTGTNGKTSCVEFLSSLLNSTKKQCGYLSTIGWSVDGGHSINRSSITTPGILEINKKLEDMVNLNMKYAAIEASSHGLKQGRLDGLTIDTAILTSFSQDHLDYHQNMENYAESKKKLFLDLSPKKSIVNVDNKLGEEIYSELKNRNLDVYGISKTKEVEVRYEVKRNKANNITLEISSQFGEKKIDFNTFSQHLASNALCSIVALLLNGFHLEDLAKYSKKIKFSEGRMQPIFIDDKNVCVIDYAHTPEALETSLRDLNEFPDTKLWCLFGCGGDRDKTKRPKMGRISALNSDEVVITNDNPRFEDPYSIVEDILEGVEDKERIKIELDRTEAINYCLTKMEKSSNKNILLIAGKGHEDIQEIDGRKYQFSDFEKVSTFINKIGKN